MISFFRLCMMIIAAVFSGFVLAQKGPELPVKSYILLDTTSGQVLADKNPDDRLPPASITKLMTAYLAFEALETGKMAMNTQITISQNAYKQEGSRMFVEINRQVSVEDLLQGLIVQSGNDAAVALAEYIGGSFAGFTEMMNQKAQQLNMTNTHYMNPTGLPDPEHYTTARDIATLSQHIINDFPQYYHYYGQKSFTYNKIKQDNRNRLLWRNASVDGLKTGHTKEAGYCLASSEKRGDIRFVVVVLGANKESERYDASQTLLNYGFAQFKEIVVLKEGQILSKVPVYKGVLNEIEIQPQHEVKLLLPIDEKGKVVASIEAKSPVIAPVTQGQELGTIRIKIGDKVYATVPAVSVGVVEEAGFFKRMWHSIKLLF
ncbi:MAG: D-alanyl-D-alanine carboxypeptidase family protein [Cardiobacteriaceae bacterium]|nr:D-alanyl-D-alanine carboxypeptidase family protein [Cardiobacteriaceae bacterium]